MFTYLNKKDDGDLNLIFPLFRERGCYTTQNG